MRSRRAGRDYFLHPSPPARPHRPQRPGGRGLRFLFSPFLPHPGGRTGERPDCGRDGKEGAGGLARMRIDSRISPSGLSGGGHSEGIGRERGRNEPGRLLACARYGCLAVAATAGRDPAFWGSGEFGVLRVQPPCTTQRSLNNSRVGAPGPR